MIDALLTPVAAEAPSGPNLEYDGEYLALVQQARGKPGQQYGDTVIPPQEPDWREVKTGAERILGRTKDVRIALLWLRGATRTDGYPGFADGLKLLAGLLDTYWDSVHPQLDATDPEPAAMRVNTLVGLVDPLGLLNDVRQAAIVGAPAPGALRVRDLELALGRGEPAADELVPTEAGVRAALAEILNGHPELAARLVEADDRVVALGKTMDARAGTTTTPSLDPLRSLTHLVATAAQATVTAASGTGEQSADSAAAGGAAGPVSAAATVLGPIRSREDALHALDQICDWLTRAEPTNPAPLVIRRAQRLMKLNFVDIIRDVAPNGLDQVLGLVGEEHSRE